MNRTEIGSELQNLRKKYGASQKMLSEGLCSTSTLSRIESGERDGGSLLLSALFQRLGKSLDDYEMFFEHADYQQFLLREAINQELAANNLSKAEVLLNEYKSILTASDKLNQQYILLAESELAVRGSVQKEASFIAELLTDAIKITIPEIEKKAADIWHTKLLSGMELELLCSFFTCISRSENSYKQGMSGLGEILFYIENHKTIPRELGRIYFKTAMALAGQYYQCQMYEEGIQICDKALERIKNTGVILHFAELTYLKTRCMENLIGISDKIDNGICRNLYLQVYYAFQFLGDKRSGCVKKMITK